jgi:hypothetical protein
MDRVSRHKSGGMARRGRWLALTLWFLSSSGTEAVSQVRPGAAQSAGVDAEIVRRVRMAEAGLAPLRCGPTGRKSGRADSSQGEAALLAEAGHFEGVSQEPRLTAAQVVQELRSDRREINEFIDQVSATMGWDRARGPWGPRTPLCCCLHGEVETINYDSFCPQGYLPNGVFAKEAHEGWALSLKMLEMRVEATGVVPAQQMKMVREAMQEWRVRKARFLEVTQRLGVLAAQMDALFKAGKDCERYNIVSPSALELLKQANLLDKELYFCVPQLTIQEQERISGRITDMNALFGPPR